MCLRARSLRVLTTLSLIILTTRGLRVLTTRSLIVLTTRSLRILTTRGLIILTARSLRVLTTRGLRILTTRSLIVLTTRSLRVLAARSLSVLTTGAGERPRSLTARSLRVLTARSLIVLTTRSLRVLTAGAGERPRSHRRAGLLLDQLLRLRDFGRAGRRLRLAHRRERGDRDDTHEGCEKSFHRLPFPLCVLVVDTTTVIAAVALEGSGHPTSLLIHSVTHPVRHTREPGYSTPSAKGCSR
jgi:hypothetical protein